MNYPPATLFDQFLKERLYLKNVTPRTLVWYQVAFNSYRASLAVDAPVLPTRATLQQFLMQLRDRGIRPVTCNTYLAAMNAFCAWLHEEQHIPERVKLKKLKVDRRVLELLNEPQRRWWSRIRGFMLSATSRRSTNTSWTKATKMFELWWRSQAS